MKKTTSNRKLSNKTDSFPNGWRSVSFSNVLNLSGQTERFDYSSQFLTMNGAVIRNSRKHADRVSHSRIAMRTPPTSFSAKAFPLCISKRNEKKKT